MSVQDVPREQTGAERAEPAHNDRRADAHRVGTGEQEPCDRPDYETNERDENEERDEAHAPHLSEEPFGTRLLHRPPVGVMTTGPCASRRFGPTRARARTATAGPDEIGGVRTRA